MLFLVSVLALLRILLLLCKRCVEGRLRNAHAASVSTLTIVVSALVTALTIVVTVALVASLAVSVSVALVAALTVSISASLITALTIVISVALIAALTVVIAVALLASLAVSVSVTLVAALTIIISVALIASLVVISSALTVSVASRERTALSGLEALASFRTALVRKRTDILTKILCRCLCLNCLRLFLRCRCC